MGVSPLFSPKYSPSQARAQLIELLRRSPQTVGYAQSRWTLAMLRHHCHWLKLKSNAALHHVLRRLGIRRKLGQAHVHSPDHSYEIKKAWIALSQTKGRTDPQRKVLVYLDECTIPRQPSVAPVYAAQGKTQPYAQQAPTGFAKTRLIGALNFLTGQVTYKIVKHLRVISIAAFMHQLAETYPYAETIYVVLDNWPVHYHADVLARLRAQPWVHARMRPAHWSDAPAPYARIDNLPIEFLPLPTYASWLNPIEKLWRKLKQERLHMHPFATNPSDLLTQVKTFMDQFQDGSSELLRYVGLLPD